MKICMLDACPYTDEAGEDVACCHDCPVKEECQNRCKYFDQAVCVFVDEEL